MFLIKSMFKENSIFLRFDSSKIHQISNNAMINDFIKMNIKLLINFLIIPSKQSHEHIYGFWIVPTKKSGSKLTANIREHAMRE